MRKSEELSTIGVDFANVANRHFDALSALTAEIAEIDDFDCSRLPQVIQTAITKRRGYLDSQRSTETVNFNQALYRADHYFSDIG